MVSKSESLTGDIFGGVTAAVVALPLALAFGVASGAGPIAGLYGAIAVGFFAAIFGGTPSQVSGPTGPMTVVMGAIVAEHASSMPDAFAIVFLGGLIQAGFGVLKVGRYISYTPYSVISGFMSGIGLIIIFIQTLPFMGLPSPSGGPLNAIEAWPNGIEHLNWQALVIAALSLGIMIFWPARVRRFLPPPLAALIVGTLASAFFLPQAPIIGNVPTGLPHIGLPAFTLGKLASFIEPAFILALLGSIDSLLTSLVADSITRTRHDSNRELIGQGIGNMFAGLIGGLPGAGATMRTVVNVRAGGRTRISGALHSVILASLLLGLAPLAERIPHAVLAGILMKVGFDIIDWTYLKRIHKAPPEKVIVMLITLGLTVFVDLITAVAVGLIVAGFVTSRWMEREELKGVTSVSMPGPEADLTPAEQAVLQKFDKHILLISLHGRFSYASARELVRRIGSAMGGHKAVVYDFTQAAHIDTTAAIGIDELFRTAQGDKVDCLVAGLSGTAEKTLQSLGVLDRLPKDNLLPTREAAIVKAGDLLAAAETP